LKVLLDTHALLWFALADPQLSETAMAAIMNPSFEKLVSPASYWEIAVKISINKYTLFEPYEVFMDAAINQNGFRCLHRA
jgi:PIN domain nuclease of toxin-antitoxin system